MRGQGCSRGSNKAGGAQGVPAGAPLHPPSLRLAKRGEGWEIASNLGPSGSRLGGLEPETARHSRHLPRTPLQSALALGPSPPTSPHEKTQSGKPSLSEIDR